MSIHFREEEFQAAWGELDDPQLEGGWDLFTETMGVKIYRRYRQVQHRQQPGNNEQYAAAAMDQTPFTDRTV